MIRRARAIKNAGPLCVEPESSDTIAVERGGMRRQTRPDARSSVFFGPVHEPCESGPVRLFNQIHRARFHAGNNQTVKSAVPEVINTEVGIDVASARIGPWHFG